MKTEERYKFFSLIKCISLAARKYFLTKHRLSSHLKNAFYEQIRSCFNDIQFAMEYFLLSFLCLFKAETNIHIESNAGNYRCVTNCV